jgi:CubicO group peptidase (beta-lactamase class C family)
MSAKSFRHSGAGGVLLWVDPVHGLVGIYFSVVTDLVNDAYWDSPVDLFANAVTAAVED